MNHKELFPIFSPAYTVANKVLLITPAEIGRLKGQNLDDCRIFLLVSAGSLTLQIGNKSCEMKACSFLDLLEGVTVRVVETSPDLRAYALLPNYEFAGESLKSLKPGPENYFLERLHFPILSISEDENNTLERQMKLLERSLCRLDHAYRQELVMVYFKSFMLEVGNLMLTHTDEFQEKAATLGKRDLVMMEFMKLVWKHFETEHGIDFYADKLCISNKHLARIVKEMLGKTPHEVICDELLHRAMALLEDDRIPVGQIAEQLHFSDQAAFCKFFKKQMKMAPMAYRKKAAAEGSLLKA